MKLQWRGPFTATEANVLHAEAFETRVFSDEEWDWPTQVAEHSLGWVTARNPTGELIGFVNVLWDGFVHAWIQDLMVAKSVRSAGLGAQLVGVARDQAANAGCEWLHVDFDPELKAFYIDRCGFQPTSAGLLEL